MSEYVFRENINDNDGNTVGCREIVVPNDIVEQIRAEVIEKIIYAEKNKFFCIEDLCDGTKDCTDCRIKYLNEVKEQK